MIAQDLEDEFDIAAMSAAGNMPAVNMIQRGVNIFNGDSFGDSGRPAYGAWEYTYGEGKVFSAPHNWNVPDQIVGIPSVTISCA